MKMDDFDKTRRKDDYDDEKTTTPSMKSPIQSLRTTRVHVQDDEQEDDDDYNHDDEIDGNFDNEEIGQSPSYQECSNAHKYSQ